MRFKKNLISNNIYLLKLNLFSFRYFSPNLGDYEGLTNRTDLT